MILSSTETVLALVGSAIVIGGSVFKGARALIRTAVAGQHLTDSVRLNTEATNRLSTELADMTTWRHSTESRFDHAETRLATLEGRTP